MFKLMGKKELQQNQSKRKTKIGFQDQLSLNAGQKYCRMLQVGILQYFRPSLSYHLSSRHLFCLFYSGRITVQLYAQNVCQLDDVIQVKTLLYPLPQRDAFKRVCQPSRPRSGSYSVCY